MKGHPFREVLIFLVVALGLLFPMAQLRTVQSSHLQHTHDASHAHGPDHGHVLAFGEVRLSHPADSITLRMEGSVLLEETNVLRTDVDLCLSSEGSPIEMQIVWSDPGEGRPFAELRIEPENRPDVVYSFWGKPGENLRRWLVEPGELP